MAPAGISRWLNVPFPFRVGVDRSWRPVPTRFGEKDAESVLFGVLGRDAMQPDRACPVVPAWDLGPERRRRLALWPR